MSHLILQEVSRCHQGPWEIIKGQRSSKSSLNKLGKPLPHPSSPVLPAFPGSWRLLEEQSHFHGARNMAIVVRMAEVRTEGSLYPESERWAFGLSEAWRYTPEGECSGKRH